MKRKNAFTLIELLAIIVILAIIAVITVPIILNIIENAKKGAAQDSAYGYKDAINKWYVQELTEDSTKRLNGTYTISNGKLNNIDIPLSGDKPTNGTLTYSNNILTGGCLTIGDYKVTFDTKGSISETIKGNCNGSAVATTCSSDEYLYEINQYVVTDQEACKAYFSDAWRCGTNEGCIEDVSNYCASESEFTISDHIRDGFIQHSDIEAFVENITDSWCRPKSEECFEISDNGDETANLDKYLCGAEWDENTQSYITDGKILDVDIPSQLTGKNGKLTVTTIGNHAFDDNQLTSVTIPNSVTTVDKNAFAGNLLTNIQIPDSVTAIGEGAFQANELSSVILGKGVTTIGSQAFMKNYAYNGVKYNSDLSVIYNNTGRSFDWKKIVDSTTNATFETGTINNAAGNVTVTTGYPSN